MFDQARLNKRALDNEKIAEKCFKKMGFSVDRLDLQGSWKRRKRPDFLVSDTSGPFLVCEVKTIFSAGFLKDRAAHISTEDPALIGTGEFEKEVSFDQIDEDLRDAVQKYRELIEDRSELKRIPLVITFFFDPFADVLDFYPSRMEEFPEVSGILKIDSGSMKGFPPPTKRFRVLENQLAENPLPRYFVDRCIMSKGGGAEFGHKNHQGGSWGFGCGIVYMSRGIFGFGLEAVKNGVAGLLNDEP